MGSQTRVLSEGVKGLFIPLFVPGELKLCQRNFKNREQKSRSKGFCYQEQIWQVENKRGLEIFLPLKTFFFSSRHYQPNLFQLLVGKSHSPGALLGDFSDHTGLGELHRVRMALHLTLKCCREQKAQSIQPFLVDKALSSLLIFFRKQSHESHIHIYKLNH